MPVRVFCLLVCFATICVAQTPSEASDEGAVHFSPTDPKTIDAQRRLRKIQLEDELRPVWHLVIPEGASDPFDPNGAIFKDGVYHLWYLYVGEAGAHWAHVSSLDLFHWRWHSNELRHRPGDPDQQILSGNAFQAVDGNVVISYQGRGTQGACIAYSSDPELNIWTKLATNPIARPSSDTHMWLQDGKYYLISGGNPPTLYTGDAYDRPMKLVGNFMKHNMPGVGYFEDISCPDFFPLGDKWVLVCISHPCGARYYIGDWDGKQFTPESHHRMNWPGGSYFAPETLLDDKGRRILWAWVRDRRSGTTSGTMAMPRVLTLGEDKLSLNITPPEEVERLRYQPVTLDPLTIPGGESVRLEGMEGRVLELDITIDPGEAQRFGIRVFCSKDSCERTPVVIDREKDLLQIDMKDSSLDPVDYREFLMYREPNKIVKTQDAPFALKDGEKVRFRIFLDKTTMEAFVNDRQCITQVVYPTLEDSIHIEAFSEDAPIILESIRSWKLFPAMQW